MKSFKFLTLIGFLLTYSDAMATAVCASQLIRKDKIVRLIGDAHLEPNEQDQEQKNNLLEQMNNSGCLLIAEDGFENTNITPEELDQLKKFVHREPKKTMLIGGIISEANKNGIKAISSEMRFLYFGIDHSTWKDGLHKAFIENFKKHYYAIFDYIPAEIKHELENLYDNFEQHISKCENESDKNWYEDDYALEEWYAISSELECKLFDFVTISHIIKNESQNNMIYVCAGANHTEYIHTVLQKIGYELIPNSKIPQQADRSSTCPIYILANSLNLKETLEAFDDDIHTQNRHNQLITLNID